jgi:peptide/nickel transport system ATP-binding protein
VSYLADEVAVMYLGRIVEQGRVEQVMSTPRHPYTEALLSAVPQVDPESRREVIRLDGDMPSPASPPDGCHFHPRCPRAEAVCRRSYPEVREFGDGSRVACHLVEP